MELIRFRQVPSWSLALGVCLTLAACGGGDGHTDHAHGQGVAAIEADTWPPKLSGIENEQSFSLRRRSAVRDTVIEAARSAVMNNRSVRLALGDEYAEFGASLSDEKSADTASFLFFNYDRNVTIEAIFEKSGNVRIVEVAAGDFQPGENVQEVAQAITIAQAALEREGFSTTGLEGTAMVTHLPASQMAVNGAGFYAERVLYVTFGDGEGELPAFSALVNLSTESASDVGPVK